MGDGIDVVVFRSDDWDAIYVDGSLVYSGSEDLVYRLMDAITGRTIHSARKRYAEYDDPMGQYLAEYGDYPPLLAEVYP